ncbi:CAAX prenyl protease 2-like protein [Drosera capensis]
MQSSSSSSSSLSDLECTISKSGAVAACIAMAVLYVATLYSPTLVLRLSPANSFEQFMKRRFACAAVSSVVSIGLASFVLVPVEEWRLGYMLKIYGVRADHLWSAVVFPLSLTSLMYLGSFVLKFLLLLDSWRESCDGWISFVDVCAVLHSSLDSFLAAGYNILTWRTFVVAPITEELVFRACMIPLLLCGGFRPYQVVFLSPIFFSLAHLNHFLEFYNRPNYSLLRASMAVGLQLGYTVLFGWYASFLFMRTGHLIAPLVTHIFCNYMGLPFIYSKRKGLLVSVAFVAGVVGFWINI